MWTHNSVSALLATALALGAGALQAQSPEARDAWLIKNYRFTGAPPAGPAEPVDPVVSELRQIQNALLSIMRKADFTEDYETALAAAGQATATAQLLGNITEMSEGGPNAVPSAPLYALAFKDRTIEVATCYWIDGLMLHYMTRQGAHVQVRLDLLDRDLTTRLNPGKNFDFKLPH